MSLAHHVRNFQETAAVHSQGGKKKQPREEAGPAGCAHPMTEAIRSSWQRVSIKINAAGNWVSQSELDT